MRIRNEGMRTMNMTELSKDIRFFNGKKGFESPAVDIHKKLLLAISEICEAQEELRDGKLPNEIYYQVNGKPCGFPVEVADAIIRLLDICGAFDIDIQSVVEEKLAYNKTRPEKHGRQF